MEEKFSVFPPQPFASTISLLPAPFESDGRPDYFALERILDRQNAAGCRVALFCDRCERASLRRSERLAFLSCAASSLPPERAPLFFIDPAAGEDALREAKDARDAGAGGLILDPLPPGSPGFLTLLSRLSDRVSLPLCVVKTPGRTSISFYAELCRLPLVLAVACPSPDPAEAPLLSRAFDDFGRSTGGAPSLLAANDALFLCAPDLFDGALSALSTVFPFAFLKTARNAADAPRPSLPFLLSASDLFSSPFPSPAVKWALHRLGVCMPTVRIPLSEPDDALKRKIDETVNAPRGKR